MNAMKTALATLAFLFLSQGTVNAAPPAPTTNAQEALTVQVHAAGPAGFHATSTLIAGAKEAVLIDAQFTLSEAHRLAAQILESGKSLSTIFVTHAHPDHYFGLEVLRRQFPKARILARPSVVADIKETAAAKLAQWGPMYGANLTRTPVIPESFTGASIVLEGHQLELVDLGGAEAEHAVGVFVPSLSTFITGDLTYNGVHMWLEEGRLNGWLETLDRIESFGAKRIIAGHKVPGREDSPGILAQNGAYIRFFQKALAESKDAAEVERRVTAKYPDLALPVIVKIAAGALAGGKSTH